MASITVGVIGLGRMGMSVAYRLVQGGFNVIGYDQASLTKHDLNASSFRLAESVIELAQASNVIWLMLPEGQVIDQVIDTIRPHVVEKTIIIDGGNSFFKDSIRRYNELKDVGIAFLDCGTSGGLHGKDEGFSLMIGGDEGAFKGIEHVFVALAAPSGYRYMGPSGAGHFVKMVHNGVEYALLQAYAEGFDLLKHGHYDNLDLAGIADVWNHGSIIRSWITQLSHNVLSRDQEFNGISGSIGENKTGAWTAQIAQEAGVDVPMLQKALDIRAWSRQTGGNYATKMVALLRHEFGGHPLKKD